MLSQSALTLPRDYFFASAEYSQSCHRGIIKATEELKMDIPLIVRLQGTKEQEAKKLIKESGMAIFPFDGLDEVSLHRS